jgi:uncharacterized iron-regulated protein
MKPLLSFAFAALLLVMTTGCAGIAKDSSMPPRLEGIGRELQVGDVIDALSGKVITFDDLVSRLAVRQVVYLGETHSSMNDHRVQRQILEALHQRSSGLIVGMEMFPRPAQHWLDLWSQGYLEEQEFLEKVDWYQNWGFPVELYRPLLEYCRANQIRIVALNAPPPIVRSIGRLGLDQLEPAERSQVAEKFDFGIDKHREAIRQQYERHMAMLGRAGGFDRFYQAQLAWEETMAETLADQLKARSAPAQIVVIIGNGHIEHYHGVPARAFRRYPHTFATVVPTPSNTSEPTMGSDVADFMWITAPEEPFRGHRGRLGVRLEPLETGKGVRIAAVIPESPAARAGIGPGDILVQIDDTPIAGIEDVHRAMMLPKSDRSTEHFLHVQRDGSNLRFSIVIPKNP